MAVGACCSYFSITGLGNMALLRLADAIGLWHIVLASFNESKRYYPIQ